MCYKKSILLIFLCIVFGLLIVRFLFQTLNVSEGFSENLDTVTSIPVSGPAVDHMNYIDPLALSPSAGPIYGPSASPSTVTLSRPGPISGPSASPTSASFAAASVVSTTAATGLVKMPANVIMSNDSSTVVVGTGSGMG